MVLVIAFALIGAALGAYLRPRALAIVLALGSAGGLRGLMGLFEGMMVKGDDAPPWQVTYAALLADPLTGYLPVIGAGAAGSVLAAVMCLFFDKENQLPFWMPQEG